MVEANQEISMIVVHCSKARSELIKGDFESLLNKIRERYSVSSKVVHYMGNTNLILGPGGSVKEVVQADYIHKCVVGNLHLEVTGEELRELFE